MHSSNTHSICILDHFETNSNHVPHLSYQCFLVHFSSLFAFLALWPHKWHKQWQAWQGILRTKQAFVWLTNQQIRLMMQFIHFTPQHVVPTITLSKLFGSTIENPHILLVLQWSSACNTLYCHANWTEEKMHGRNIKLISSHCSSHIGFVTKCTETTIHALKNCSYQKLTISSKAILTGITRLCIKTELILFYFLF